jgi:hypothetical protein
MEILNLKRSQLHSALGRHHKPELTPAFLEAHQWLSRGAERVADQPPRA